MRTRLMLIAALIPALAVAATVLLFGEGLLLAAVAATVCALSFAAAVYFGTATHLRRIEEIGQAARRSAAGELSLRLTSEVDDELGRLLHSLNQAGELWAQKIQELQAESTTLLAVLDGMSEGVWVTDPEGNVIRHNLALKALLFAGQELVGKRPLAILRSTELNAAVVRACESGESATLEVTVEGVRPRVLSVYVAPLKDIGGSAAVFRDITELRRLEKIRKDFVANVSHELRTPITAIRGYAETLRDGALKDVEHAPNMVEIIHRQSERLSELVEDLLELSRLEAKELNLELVDVKLLEVAQRALEVVRQRAASKKITITLALPPDLVAKGDERAVEQVFLNLFDNAVKYTPENGRVEVSFERKEGRILLAVRDSGVGIEEKHVPRVFERFYRVDKGRSRDMGGTGLGLSIVKHLMTAMQGDVTVSSRPGAGSTFTLSLPVTSPASNHEDKAPM